MKGKRALVPGCGRGYDVVAFALGGVRAAVEHLYSWLRSICCFVQHLFSARWLAQASKQVINLHTGGDSLPPEINGGDAACTFHRLAARAQQASNAVGLEISETAINAANAYIKEQNLPADVSPRATVLRGDFFTHSATFDVGYDYTFFCALHPDMRKDWAAGWARIIVPGGAPPSTAVWCALLQLPDVEVWCGITLYIRRATLRVRFRSPVECFFYSM